MKGVLALFLIFNIVTVFAENKIIAIVNNSPITYQSIESILSSANSYKQKIDIVNQKINSTLQIQKTKELNIEPSLKDLNLALISIAKTNNISIEQLRSYPEFLSLKIEVLEKISILNLQKFITKDIKISEAEVLKTCTIENTDKGVKQIKIAQIIISEFESQAKKNQDMAIKEFLNKLSKYISKGASFEAFAKLHSQHSSYAKGGVTDWIEVNSPTVIMLDMLKDNEVSQIYMTNFGFAIGIKLEERFVSSDLKKCKEKLIYLKAEKFYSNWVKGLREEAYIKIYHDLLQ
jgi:parvulin-like peptidyl-prolyl isomerase